MQLKKYCDHLYDVTTDGYIHVVQIGKNKEIKVFNTSNECIREIVESIDEKEDIYITPNTTYIPIRKTSTIRQYRALFQDLDLDKLEYSKDEVVCAVYILHYEGKIPKPSMIIDSGRGLHLYWRIDNAPYGAWATWQELQDYLYYQLKHLGADKKATDSARVLRLPSTINSKNGAVCTVIENHEDIQYSMYDLREKYLNYKKKEKTTQIHFHETKAKPNGKVIPNKFFNSYSLHLARMEDVETLCKLRSYDMRGCRNAILHCYAYWKGIVIRDDEVLREDVYSLNSAFKEPLKATEVDAILRCVPKAIDKFIAYEQGLRSGEVKRVSKGMKDKGGYWYKNETLIEIWEVTREEQTHLKTVIDEKEKYRRRADDQKAKKKAKRRNENGLTKREQEKQDKIKAVKELYNQGYKQVKIAEKLGLTKGTVSKYIKL